MEIENEGSSSEEEFKSPNLKPRNLSLTENCKAYIYSEEGRSYTSIAQEIDRDPKTIRKLYNKALITNSLDNQHANKGRYSKGSSILTDRHRIFILEWLEAGIHNSSNQIYIHLISIRNLSRVSYSTVKRYVNTVGKWVKPRLRTVISQKNLIRRKEYCEDNIHTITTQDLFSQMKATLN